MRKHVRSFFRPGRGLVSIVVIIGVSVIAGAAGKQFVGAVFGAIVICVMQ